MIILSLQGLVQLVPTHSDDLVDLAQEVLARDLGVVRSKVGVVAQVPFLFLEALYLSKLQQLSLSSLALGVHLGGSLVGVVGFGAKLLFRFGGGDSDGVLGVVQLNPLDCSD